MLDSSPWLQSRTLSVLALMDSTGEGATTFTLRTSVRRPRIEAEITKASVLRLSVQSISCCTGYSC